MPTCCMLRSEEWLLVMPFATAWLGL